MSRNINGSDLVRKKDSKNTHQTFEHKNSVKPISIEVWEHKLKVKHTFRSKLLSCKLI